MDFSLSEEQTLFRDTVARFLSDSLPFDKRQAIVDTHPGYSADHWHTLAELGILGLPFSENTGGLGGSAFDTMVVMDQMGRALLTGPYVSTVLLSGAVLDRVGADGVEDIIGGARKVAFAYAERGAGYNLNDISLTANKNGDDYVLSGKKIAVLHADTADDLIILARTSGAQRDQEGLSLFMVPAGADGLSMTAYALQDGNRGADITFDGVRAKVLGDVDNAFGLVEEVADQASSALCAEASGIMWAIYDLTLEYIKTRSQFGTALGSFQALQHRMVDMYMMCQMAESMTYEAALAFDHDDPDARRRSVSAAKSLIGAYGRKVGQEGIQLHGGIGMTLEYSIGHYFKRLTMIDATFGDSAWHDARYARLMLTS
ncbi:MAG: pimeloyl-CoA dehydrogenase small subunit [Rhodospirillales bacterium]|jgi:alkylation response protein AidB-like acyl-CoA dehydrogenase|nr:pimeloyl-CoA dehydrogenase small subunit [Rhodospirillales bacterium]MBT4041745.1 pimeloyl-CoA dehydrogenase small subunit [Rhodospirillales bacterium]MBT4627928.1 pimeloyl-CoA dehydrogenase small subunit [Rhodospirillales bacterium]MBT5350657.1 pimeloyl-CoA dehydrogenase small subunit [Rhodospirillales bacterium]MBT5520580.1 pimeloyl-CoA dehydrogenase small subunit [Rhodospirillales bacterium]